MINNLDIIIPVYNDADGLFISLCSIASQGKLPIKVIIVDDGSNEKNNYNEVVKRFTNYLDIKFIQLSSNRGPATARNAGLEQATARYVSFLDCGDVYVNTNSLAQTFNDIKEHPESFVFSYAHTSQKGENRYDDEYIPADNNRLMGKVYNKLFLDSFGIKFNEEAGRANEDIGFNVLCRLICEDLNHKYLFESDTPMVRWSYNSNSLTRKNNYAFWYVETESMAKNMIYAYRKASELHVDEKLIQADAYNAFSFIYTLYIGALNEQSPYERDVFIGARYFYNNYFSMDEVNPQLFLQVYNEYMATLDYNDAFYLKFPPFTIIEFLNILSKEKITNE